MLDPPAVPGAGRILVEVKVWDMAGEPVKTLFMGDLSTGLQSTFWDGRDANQLPAPGKNFWVTFVSGADERAHLVFR